MKRIFIVIVSAVAAFAAAQGQNPISQQIEVTREYRPDVERADKLAITPDMSDTVSLKPDVEYGITPTPWKTVFDAAPISPVRISAAEYVPAWPYYIRFGAGVPGTTLFDLYATARNRRGAYGGVYVNHHGEWAKLENDLGEKLRANNQRNVIGAFAATRIAGRELNAGVALDTRNMRAFGFYDDGIRATSGDPDKVILNDLSAAVRYGDTFKDLSRFNWRAGVTANNFFNADASMSAFGAEAAVAAPIGAGVLALDLDYGYRHGGKELDGYKNSVLGAVPKYEFTSDKFDLSLGLLVASDTFNGDSSFFVAPMIKVQYNFSNILSPYARADGGITQGDFLSLSFRNPFILQESWLRNSHRTGFRAGIFGSASNFLAYDFFAGLDTYENYHFFVNDGARFDAYDDINPTVYYGGATVNARIMRGLNFDFSARINSVGRFDYDWDEKPGIGVPDYELAAALKYSYNDKIFLSLGCGLMGERDASELYFRSGSDTPSLRTVTLPSAVNLKAEGELKVAEHMAFFVTLDNILNEKIYVYNHYPRLGATVIVGVKLKF